MNILKSGREKKPLSEKKKFSFKANGVTSYHAAPAALMVAAGLALSSVIGDVQPVINQAFALTIEAQLESNASILNEFATQLGSSSIIFEKKEEEESEVGFDSFEVSPIIAADILEEKNAASENNKRDFADYTSALSEEDVTQKLTEYEKEERYSALYKAQGQVVASYNRNLYLDTYSYQRGYSNIPSTGEYTSCIPGVPISEMQVPDSLTFDENGVPENYLYCIEGKSTAYYGGSSTATGSRTRPGVVAVDPREIPYGTEMWIVSSDGRYVYGFARAEDTGGFIYWENGATVDLYMNSYADCCAWGWRGVKIYVLPTSYK